MDKTKKSIKYNYSTDIERISKVKILAIKEGKTVNKLIDEIIDAYLALNGEL